MKWIVTGIIGVVCLGLITGVSCVDIRARQVVLRESYEAEQKNLQSTHDNVWKTIKEKFNLTESYKDGFVKSLNAVVEGRKGGSFVKTVQENMPGLPATLYQEMAATIEGKRDLLLRANQKSADVAREYNSYVGNPWKSWALNDTKRIDAKVITSGKTNEAYQSGEDNEVLVPSSK